MRHLHISGLRSGLASAAAALLGLTLLDLAGRRPPPGPRRARDPAGPDDRHGHGRAARPGLRARGRVPRQLREAARRGPRAVAGGDHPRRRAPPGLHRGGGGSRRGWYHGDFTLADWRPELHTALLRVSRARRATRLVAYDVATGARTRSCSPSSASTIGLAPDGARCPPDDVPDAEPVRSRRPAGLGRHDVRDHRRGPTARPSRRRTARCSSPTRARRALVDRRPRGAHEHLRRHPRRLPPPPLVRRRLVGRDLQHRRVGSQLRRVALDGSWSPLGIRHTDRTRRLGAPILDDDDVRSVRGTRWFESYGGCGGGVLTRQNRAAGLGWSRCRDASVPCPSSGRAVTTCWSRSSDDRVRELGQTVPCSRRSTPSVGPRPC